MLNANAKSLTPLINPCIKTLITTHQFCLRNENISEANAAISPITPTNKSPCVSNPSTPVLFDVNRTEDIPSVLKPKHVLSEKNDTTDTNNDISNGQEACTVDNAIDILNEIRKTYFKNIVIGHLNINSLVNKFDALKLIIEDRLDILVLVETKLDDSFPEKQFIIEGYTKPYRLDRNFHGGGVLIYVRKDIPSKELKKHNFSKNIEAMFIEINLRKSKLLLVGTYHSKHPIYGTSDLDFFEQIGFALDVYSSYDRFLLVGDFNVQINESSIDDFLDEFGAKNLVKDFTCFKSTINPSCIDLFLTNSSKSFQSTKTISTGLSDFHQMIVTVLKITFPKAKPKVLTYRDYSNFLEDKFRNDLRVNLQNVKVKDYESFEKVFLDVLNNHAPHKKR